MAGITQTITELPEVAGRYDGDFIETADNFLNKLPTFSNELNTFAEQTNEVRDEVNNFKEETVSAKIVAITAQNFMGEWDSDTDYTHPCSVKYNGVRYASLQDSKDKQPDTEDNYWFQVDGAGSGLDSDKLDGFDSSQFLRSDEDDETTGDLLINDENKGIILIDRDDNTKYRLFITSGNLGMEEVE